MALIETQARLALESRMSGCEQAPGLTVLDHGNLVRDRYDELLAYLRDGSPLTGEWRLPEWISDPRLIRDLPDAEVMAAYLTFHDCGKPDVLTIGEDGRRHFPGHAEASERVWLEAGGDPRVGRLIGMDMDVHLLKDEGVASFAARPEARALLLAGLAEIHANASMFGGVDAVSFKMKWKNLDRRGKAILKALPA